MLELREVTKWYYSSRFAKTRFFVVDRVSLAIHPGKTLGLIGESGSGKTTLGLMAAHLIPHESGEIILDGEKLEEISKRDHVHIRKRIQVIFQSNESALDPRMKTAALIREPFVVNRIPNQEICSRELMDIVGLSSDLADRYPHELSGGQRQRICIARAIALNPDYLIADEPAASLDYSIQAQILELLATIQKERQIGLLFISHHLKIIRIIADVVAVMFLGKIVEKSPKNSLFSQPLHPYTRDLLAALPGIHRRDIIQITENTIIRNQITGCPYYPRCSCRDELCTRLAPDLTEIMPDRFVACHYPCSDEYQQSTRYHGYQ